MQTQGLLHCHLRSPALRHVLGIHQRYSAQRRSHIILITDGQVANEEAVLKEVSGEALPVHRFGIDHAVNEAFLRQLAGQQRGTSVFLTPNDDLVRPVAILGSRLNRPAFTHLTLDKDWELAGTELPDIYVGQVAFAPVRTKGNRSDVKVAGKDSAGRPSIIQLHAQDVKTDLPKLIWMKRRIESLLQGGKVKEAITLAEKANLVCRGTAFIAWDEAEEVAIAQDEVYQPSLNVPSSLPSSVNSAPQVALMPARGAAFMPGVRESLHTRRESFPARPSLFKRKMTEWWNSVLAGRSDTVLEEPKRLTEQLSRTIESAFSADDAKKLSNIVLDWAKHTDDRQIIDRLRPLLRECERHGDAGFLRKVLSNFFLSLPDPWQTRANSILSAVTAKIGGGAVR